jgi:HIRAN domain-containing protein
MPPEGSSGSDAGSADGEAAGARREKTAAEGGGGRLRIWLERGESGFWLRDAATGDAMKWDDPRVRVVKLAGASYRADALQDDAFAPGRPLALVPEPQNEHDPNAVGVWDAEQRLQGGYVPAEVAPELRGDEQAVSLWEFRGDDRRRIGLRVLLVPAGAWVQEPRA